MARKTEQPLAVMPRQTTSSQADLSLAGSAEYIAVTACMAGCACEIGVGAANQRAGKPVESTKLPAQTKSARVVKIMIARMADVFEMVIFIVPRILGNLYWVHTARGSEATFLALRHTQRAGRHRFHWFYNFSESRNFYRSSGQLSRLENHH